MTEIQITYFLKVAEQMSFSKAAQDLFVSQPSISRQIKLLEQELGMPLIDRTDHNAISLTPAGIVFRDAFLKNQKEMEDARILAASLSESGSMKLDIGIGEYWDFTDELIAFRERLYQKYPHAEIRIQCSPFSELHKLLNTGRVDTIICTKTSLMSFDGLELQKIADSLSCAYVKKGLLCPPDEPLRKEMFENQALLMLSEDESPMAMELAQMQFLPYQISVRPTQMPNRDSILQGLLMGDGFSVFDQYVRFREDPRLTYCPLDDMIPLCVVWKKNVQNPLVRYFAECMEELMERTE